MKSLSNVASESYDKSYPSLIQLHQIREIEDAVEYLEGDHLEEMDLVEKANADYGDGWAWDGRLSLMSTGAALTTLNTRLALARLGRDKMLESKLLLQVGRLARKRGSKSVSETALFRAEASLLGIAATGGQTIYTLVEQARTQYAKLKRDSGSNAIALKILGLDSMETSFNEMMQLGRRKDGAALKQIAAKHERTRMEGMLRCEKKAVEEDEDSFSDLFARRLLRLTQWTVDGGMHDGAIIDRFEIVIALSNNWEKGEKPDAVLLFLCCKFSHFLRPF